VSERKTSGEQMADMKRTAMKLEFASSCVPVDGVEKFTVRFNSECT
jgi:hypothetical protein